MSTLTGAYATTPRRSLAANRQKPTADIGWISHSTYEELPPRIQRAAKMLQERGEIQIEGHYDEGG